MGRRGALDPGQGAACPRLPRLPAMRALHRRRGRLAGWLAAVLLFAQLATAAYACPQLTRVAPEQVAAAMAAGADADAAAMAAMPDCSGNMPAAMDPEQPQLCKAHCEAGNSSVNSQSAAPDVPQLAATDAAWVGVVDPAAAAGRAAGLRAPVADAPPAGRPPLYLSFLVLRN